VNENAPEGASLFGFAAGLLNAAVQITKIEGPTGGFWQAFDNKPEDEDSEPEMHRDRLERVAARDLMRRRKSEGFDGFCGYCCFEPGDVRLYTEAFDTDSGKGIALSGQLRKTIFGRYKPSGDNAEIVGFPTL
jgi:hypothetical protein